MAFKSFADPVDDTTLLVKGLNVRSTWDEDGVKHGGAYTLEMVMWLDAFAALALTICVDGLALGTNDIWESLGSFECCVDAVEGDWVIAVCDKDGDTTTGNCWFGCVLSGNAEAGGLLASIWLALLCGGRCTRLFGGGLCKFEVNVAETLSDRLVHNWVVAAIELEAQGGDQMHLLRWGLRVSE